MVPDAGSTMRLKQRSNVVLPDPLSPTSASVRPATTSIDTSTSAGALEPYRCDTAEAASVADGLAE
jgi:hypothetical protein